MALFLFFFFVLLLLVVYVSRVSVPDDRAMIVRWKTPQIPIIRELFGAMGLPIEPVGDNQVVALDGQTGKWTARHWNSGGWWIPFVRVPFLASIRFFPPIKVGQKEVGIMTAKDGRLHPETQNCPDPLDNINFSDGEGCIIGGLMRGTQVQTLGPGVHFVNPELWDPRIDQQVDITPAIFPDDPYNRGHPTTEMWPRIGLVDVRVGRLIPEDEKTKRTLALKVPGHRNFSDLLIFLLNEGEQGIQEEIVEPGSTRVNSEYVSVEKIFVTRVKPGWTIVLISSQGVEPVQDDSDFLTRKELGRRRPVHVLRDGVTSKRGTLARTLGPRDWYINPWRFKRILVKTAPQTLVWDRKTEYPEEDVPLRQFPPMDVESREGFRFNILAALVFEVKDQDAPMMTRVAGGGTEKLVKAIGPMVGQVVHRICRRHPMIDFVHDTRKGIAAEITKAVKLVLAYYYISVHGFQIMDLDYVSRDDGNLAEFLRQLAEQETAVQRELANRAGIPAEVARIALEEKKGEADRQKVIQGAIGDASAIKEVADAMENAVGKLVPDTGVDEGLLKALAGAWLASRFSPSALKKDEK